MLRPRLATRIALPLCAAALTLAAAGCSSGSAAAPASATSPSASPGAATTGYDAQVLAIGRQFAACARSHGVPNFADPAVQNGDLTFPNTSKTDVEAAQEQADCVPILRQVPPRPADYQPPPPETLQHMRQFARCMREHGIADWPDPNANGTFPIRGTPLGAIAAYSGGDAPPPPALMAARQACLQYEDEWRVHAS
jgi:hypothetical protein